MELNGEQKPEPKHYVMHAEPAVIDLKEKEVMIERLDAESVVDIKTDPGVVNQWLGQAAQVRTGDDLLRLIEALLGSQKYSVATTPFAYASIALGALKMATESSHGKLDENQWQMVIGILEEAVGLN